MQKFGLLSQKLTEISKFQNYVKLRFHVTLVTKIAITHSILKLQDSSFLCKPDFTRRKNHICGARL